MTGLEALLVRYGLVAIFLGAGLEGETAVVLGGVIAHRGIVAFPLAIGAAFLGSFSVDQILFWLGRRHRESKWVVGWTQRSAFRRAIGFVERHPTSFLLAFRFVYGMRVASPLAIGTSSISAQRFFLLNLISAGIWASLFTTVGFAFGTAIEQVFGRIRSVEHTIFGVLAAAGAVALLIYAARRTRSTDLCD